MKPYQLRYGLALCGLVPFMFCVSLGEAIAQINPETNFLAQAQPVTITGIRLDPQPNRVNIILETAAGQTLNLPGQPFIQRGTDLVATVEPASLV